MHIAILAGSIALSLCATQGFAQQAPTGATVSSNVPGKVSVAQTAKASAVVTAIDSATRTITLKRADGQTFDLVAGDEVKNFAQIKVGDEVAVQYARALTIGVKKASGAPISTVSTDAVKAAPGQKPGGAMGGQVTVTADVVAVDPKKSTITLKGPKGKLVDLDVKNPDHFKVVKVGDQVEAVYTEAIAIAVEPAAKKAAKK